MENVRELRPGTTGLDLIGSGRMVPVDAVHLRRLLEIEAEAKSVMARVERHERLCYRRIAVGAFDRLRAALAPNKED